MIIISIYNRKIFNRYFGEFWFCTFVLVVKRLSTRSLRTAFKAGVLWKCATCLQMTCRWNVRRLLGHGKIVLGTFGLRQVLWIIKASMEPRTRVEFWRVYACNWEKRGRINLLSRSLVIERRREVGFLWDWKKSYKIQRGVTRHVLCLYTIHTFRITHLFFVLSLKSFLSRKMSENLEGNRAYFFYIKNDRTAGAVVRVSTLGWRIDKRSAYTRMNDGDRKTK